MCKKTMQQFRRPTREVPPGEGPKGLTNLNENPGPKPIPGKNIEAFVFQNCLFSLSQLSWTAFGGHFGSVLAFSEPRMGAKSQRTLFQEVVNFPVTFGRVLGRFGGPVWESILIEEWLIFSPPMSLPPTL